MVGNEVTYRGAPGIGRVARVDDAKLQIDFFESAAEPVAESVWLDRAEVRRVLLGEQTRVFFRDGEGRWRSGRVVGGGPDIYFVRVPNMKYDVDIAESRLRVRWEKPPRDPLQVLLSGANETPRFRDVREPVRRLLLAERAASSSASGIVSAGVRIHAHQVSAALRIIRDPVQRYLLADEVGMGKTIQAGLVMRQLLIDKPGRRIGIIVPDALMAQWRSELLGKFYLDDFLTPEGELPFSIVPYSAPGSWRRLQDRDLLVVDEAHMLAKTSGPMDRPYRDLAAVAHAVPRLLMLSATPFSRNEITHLALLHLLDPQLFRWEDREGFSELLGARHELALAVFGLDDEPDPDNPELLDLQFEEIRQLLPRDETLHSEMRLAVDAMKQTSTDPNPGNLESLRLSIARVRTHLSETYRLHHRVIRNRRHMVQKQRLDDGGLLTPFEFTGRTRPRAVRLDSSEVNAGAEAVSEWARLCSAAILDHGLDPKPYARILGIMASRMGGPALDLHSVLAYRVRSAATNTLLPEEQALLKSAGLLDFEAAILDRLDSAVNSDGCAELASAIAQRCHPSKRAVVFCGRGALAEVLADGLRSSAQVKHAFTNLNHETESDREAAVMSWREHGGILIVDDSGDVGRNFQDAELAFHVRLPWNPNSLEQRIGRVDRYGSNATAQQFVLLDSDPDGLHTAWVKILVSGFQIFTESISTLQEAVDELASDVWKAPLVDGIEGLMALEPVVADVLRAERRRVNELDALEASYGTNVDGETMATAIASYEEDVAGIDGAFTRLIGGVEGFRFACISHLDGSVTFERDYEDKPLLSPRLLSRLETTKESRTGYFDRWHLRPGRRLFRRGNPFIDGIQTLLDLDDRGQAVAMWRLNRGWRADPTIFFGFDFLIEADTRPMLELLAGQPEAEPIARRRADAALSPLHERVWIPAHNRLAVTDPKLAEYLSSPYLDGRDANLNARRIAALHALLGGESNLETVAKGCFASAREHVEVVADVKEAARRAVDRIHRETEIVVAQSKARSQAARLVSDPAALEAEVAMGQAIEVGVASPVIRVTGVSCVVVSADSWADYVPG